MCFKYYSREINVYEVCVQPMSYYLTVCWSTHRRGRSSGFLCSWARWRCRPALLWSTWPTAGSASGGGGSSTPGPPSQTRPASCPLEEEEQNNWWIYTMILYNLVCFKHYFYAPSPHGSFISRSPLFLSLTLHHFQQKLILVFLLLSSFLQRPPLNLCPLNV